METEILNDISYMKYFNKKRVTEEKIKSKLRIKDMVLDD